MMKKILSVILALVMAFGVFAMSASASEDVLYGDLTNDSQINSQDALIVLQSATGLKAITSYQIAIADANADGKVNSTDALMILQLATGLKESFDKSYDKTLKATVVDPVFDNDKFTFNIKMTDKELGDFDMVFSTDGNAKVMATSILYMDILPIEIRMLHLDGKNYQVVPPINSLLGSVPGAYCEIEDDVAQIFDNYVILFTTDMVYSSTTEKKIGGQAHDCETFYNKAGACFEFYFLNDELKRLVVTNKESSQTFDISDLEKGADAARLVIPSGCVYDETLVKG